jgi:hypothetical protein
MAKKSVILLFFVSFAFAITACQSLPGFNLFSSDGQQSDQAAPVSNFVDPRQSIQARMGEPLAIASYHRGHDKLATLEISVNGQPLRSEATAGQPNVFPASLATAEVLVRGQPAQATLQRLTYPSPACQNLTTSGGPVQTSSVPLQPPSSVWTVCHIWIGQTPGVYKLSLVAVDEAGHRGEPIVQQIEVR